MTDPLQEPQAEQQQGAQISLGDSSAQAKELLGRMLSTKMKLAELDERAKPTPSAAGITLPPIAPSDSTLYEMLHVALENQALILFVLASSKTTQAQMQARAEAREIKLALPGTPDPNFLRRKLGQLARSR